MLDFLHWQWKDSPCVLLLVIVEKVKRDRQKYIKDCIYFHIFNLGDCKKGVKRATEVHKGLYTFSYFNISQVLQCFQVGF